ncbi:MAG: family 10 glycosylhydrolase [Planctomycetota bacterium]
MNDWIKQTIGPVLLTATMGGLPGIAAAQGPGPAGEVDGAFRDYRAVWLSRFEFSNEASIRGRIQAIADAGFTEVVFQVRGQGDVLFPSSYETWDPYEFPSGAPSFDPLGVAVEEAHNQGLNIHAWLNTIPMWRDTSSPHQPPTNPNHFYNAHPELRLKDINGNDMPLSSGQYVGVNPTHPGTVYHLTGLIGEMVRNYDLDGVHLDYIRMVTSGSSSTLTYPQDPDSRARFTNETGLNPDTAPNQYKVWVGDKITALVAAVQDTVAAEDPDAQLSAAVWRDYDIGTNDYQQRADEWVEGGLLDTAMPMIYTSNDALFRNNFLKWKSLTPNAGISAGLGSYLHPDADQTIRQLDTAQYLGANGYTAFSYGTLFDGNNLNAFGQAVKDYNTELASREDHLLPITDFEDGDEGYFGTSPQLSGSNFGIGSGTTATITEDVAFRGNGSQEINIDGASSGWFLRHLSGDAGGIANPAGNREFIAQGSIGFWLRTFDENLSVRLAMDDVEGTGERGVARSIVADGEWHLYEWSLDDDSQWEGWVAGNGVINGETVSLDSIQFFGSGDATVWLDKVAFNPFGTLSLEDISALAGDYNGNGVVDAADYTVWADNFGSTLNLAADGNGDGVIDAADYTIWADNFGVSAGASGATTLVPEPNTALLAVPGLMWGLSRRRRDRTSSASGQNAESRSGSA